MKKNTHPSLRVALIYAAFGMLWISLSDKFLAAVITDTTTLTHFQTFKGFFYVVITAALVFFLMQNALKHQSLVEQKLRDSEERWKFAVEGAGDGMWDWNYQTGDAMFSKRYKEMLGFDDSDIWSDAAEWKKRVHPDDLPAVIEALQEHMNGNTASAEIEFRMLCKDDSWKWILGRGIVVSRNNDGKPMRLVGTNTDITSRKQMEEQVRQLAYYDALTHLPNRRMLDDRLTQAMARSKRSGRYGALFFIDLDNFKTLNDRYGHHAGDLLLIDVAQRLTSGIREMDTVARFGGDEFVVMLSELEGDKAAAVSHVTAVAEKILASLGETYEIALPDGMDKLITHRCNASIGVVMFLNHEASKEELLKWADTAMYKAKEAGRNQFRFYEGQGEKYNNGKDAS